MEKWINVPLTEVLPLRHIATMKSLLTLCLLVFLASFETLFAQDTLKIRGKEPALVVRVLQVAEQELIYADFVTQETGTVSVSKIERLVIKDNARRFQLSDADETVKKLIKASSPKDFVEKLMLKEDPSASITWSQHLDYAGANYDGASILGLLSVASLATPLFVTSSDATFPQIMGGLSVGFGVAGFIMYLSGNSHLRNAARKAESSRIGVISTPSGLGVAFRFNR